MGSEPGFLVAAMNTDDNAPLFPPDCIIDVHKRRLLRIEGNTIVREEPTDQEFWT